MRTEITYIADDGSRFQSEDKCLEYEKLQGLIKHRVKWFTSSLEIIDENNLSRIESDGLYCCVIGPGANKYFEWLNKEIGIGEPECLYNDGDVLKFDMNGNWSNITRIVSKYAHVIITTQEKIKQLGIETPVLDIDSTP